MTVGVPQETEIAIPLEVKGCWNPGVVSALGDQLVDRYMHTMRSNVGIYVVFWFGRDHPCRTSLADLKADLAKQVRALSMNGRRVETIVIDASLGAPSPSTARAPGQSRSRRRKPGSRRVS